MMANSLNNGLDLGMIECCVCLQSMIGQEPRILPCWHSFCSECLQSLAEVNGGLVIKCPTCRTMHEIPDKGILKFPRNFFVEQLQNTQSNTQNHECQSCTFRGRRRSAEYRCGQCDRRLCEMCKNHHNAIPACAKHTVNYIGISELALRCGCLSNTVSYLCANCLEPLCVDCILSDKHINHTEQIMELGHAIPQERKSLEQILELLETSMEGSSNTLSSMNPESSLQMNERLVMDQVERVKRRAELEGEDVIRKLRKLYQNVTPKHIDVTELRESLENARSVYTELEYTLGYNDATFVSNLKEVKRKAEKTIEHLNSTMKECHISNIKFVPSKPLAPGKLIGVLLDSESDSKELWQIPNSGNENKPRRPPRTKAYTLPR